MLIDCSMCYSSWANCNNNTLKHSMGTDRGAIYVFQYSLPPTRQICWQLSLGKTVIAASSGLSDIGIRFRTVREVLTTSNESQ